MNNDQYESFAGRYDLTPEKFDENDPLVVEFFSKLFDQHDVRTVLDWACGTGRHLLLFHSLGREVWGSDASAAMLDQTRQNLAHHGIKAPLRSVDYRDLPLHFARSFDAVVCLAAIGYMPNEAQLRRALSSMYNVPRKGGVLILTTIPTDKQWQEKPGFILAHNAPDITRLFVIDYLEKSVRYNILDIYHEPEANEMKVWSAELSVILKTEQERLLTAAGFQRVHFYGAFDFSPYDKERSERLITVAYK
jgi:glycine/sarcosine N-methyltransferase